jgi:hypothetical protein
MRVEIVEREAHLTPALSPPACSLVRPGKTPMSVVPHCAKMASMARLKPAP